jgi:hypothetical protein
MHPVLKTVVIISSLVFVPMSITWGVVALIPSLPPSLRHIYLNERTVVRICKSGSKIYSWRGEFWTVGPREMDDRVSVPLETICSN